VSNRRLLATVALTLPINLLAGQAWAKPAAAPMPTPAPASATAPAKAEAKPAAKTDATDRERERWYALMIMGKKSGYMQSTLKREGDRITTRSNLVIAMRRGELKIELGIDTTFVETADGKPVSMTSVRKLGTLPTTETVEFGATEMTISTKQGDNTTVTRKPNPKEVFLAPAAAERFLAAEQAKGNKKITVRTIDPSDGPNIVTLTREIGASQNLELLGKTVQATRASSTIDKFPGIKTEEYLSDDGELLKTIVNLGGIKMEQLLSDRDLAMADKDVPELLVSTIVKLDKPIENARTLQKASYVLTVTDGELPELPNVGFQQFARVAPGAGRVTLDLARGGSFAAPADEKIDYLAASGMLNWRDPAVEALLKKALTREITDEAARAEALRVFVHRTIATKDMSVGFASASETARTLTGDCTEHAVLLAALMRGANIRSRVVSGMVYVDGFAEQKHVFGYHMWAQALISTPDGAKWVDFDAALDPKHAFDATHITLGVSALADGDTQNYLVTMAPLIGRLVVKPAN